MDHTNILVKIVVIKLVIKICVNQGIKIHGHHFHVLHDWFVIFVKKILQQLQPLLLEQRHQLLLHHLQKYVKQIRHDITVIA